MPEPQNPNPEAQDDDVDDQNPEPGTGEGTQDGDNGSNDSQGGESVENLKALIAKLRPHERESKRLQRELAAAQAKLQEHEDEKLSEAERLKKEADDAKARLTALQGQLRTASVRHAVESAARDLGFHMPDDAHRYLDLEKIELDDEGKPQGVKPLIEALAKERPHLVGDKTGKQGPPPTQRAGEPHKMTDDERRKQAANVRDYF